MTHHPNCGGWRWFLRETAPNARGDAHRGRHCLHGLSSWERIRVCGFLGLMSAPEEEFSVEQSRQEKTRRRLIVGLWIVMVAVSTTGWLVALAWIAYLLIGLMS